MLPFRQSSKNNGMASAAPKALTRKSDRESLKAPDLPYNGSASYYRSAAPPAFNRYPTPLANGFRQRPRPTYLQMCEPSSNRLSVPTQGGFLKPTPPVGYGRPRPLLSPILPPSPGLDQVLTEMRPGPNVAWFCERKKDKSKLWSYRYLLVSIFVLLTVGVTVYKSINFVRGDREGYQLELPDETLQEEPEVLVNDVDNYSYREEYIEKKVEHSDSIILAGNFTEESESEIIPTVAATIKILYSINEDMESTVEVIEG